MPIRTHRGRAAVYRRLWGWPLRSPRHLVLAVVGFVALATAVGLVLPEYGMSSRQEPPRPSRTAAAPPPAFAPGATGPSPSEERRAPRVHSSIPQAAPPPAAPAPEALEAARNWGRAWVNHPQGMTSAQWLEGLRPYTTEEYLTVMSTVDPANVPASRLTGDPAALSSTAGSVQVKLPTDAGDLQVLVISTQNGWRVAGYTRAG
ncbi:hypothetical protein LX15_003391 [Streptoalloteichus tenebrarius]|uniref:Secreted protein n=1 Tax=Streptoalloteichus tenebrarius (strain ATCC 17920 / DSM 40477 / JCM 4838 / CBS 697.72 / NBRC 16177 / NCIMB 11028 / NRRL B-12390 / A12253. 1 / ISP 5477) TaxID=1933 RepID=A0ABT1HW94_STRSD|nr:hypothetical protein [Streptoalloteichus tenebrarius]MCP2259685.1 hypothetical protein [Streptoalloteichus tenebrarius]BFF00662.1 hypothetical protein GCM10020241_23370 [Streptoalloteichus tenebrarius]